MKQLFELAADTPPHVRVAIRVSILELYLEKVRDLLDYSQQDLKIREHLKRGVYI